MCNVRLLIRCFILSLVTCMDVNVFCFGQGGQHYTREVGTAVVVMTTLSASLLGQHSHRNSLRSDVFYVSSTLY